MDRWRRCWLVFLLLCSLALPACAPVVIPPGPPVETPSMSADALTMADGARLPLHAWLPEAETPKAVMLAVHGFNDYGAFFADIGDYLAAQGVACYAYDQRGFGAAPEPGYWAGEDAYPNDVRTVAGVLRQRHPDAPLYVFGESMGGAVVMVAASEPPGLDADGYVLSAPAVWARETMPFYQRWVLAIAAHTVPWLELTGRGLDIKPSDNIEMLREWSRDPLVIKETRVDTIHGLVNLMDRALDASPALPANTLILYGANDEVIRKEPTREMMRRLEGDPAARPRIALYDNGYHMLTRDLAAEIVWRDVAAWMNDPQTPLPSGADQAGRHFAAEAALPESASGD